MNRRFFMGLLTALLVGLLLSGCGAPSTNTNPAVPPSISVQPTDQTISLGLPATFTVVATGTPALTYQWFQGTTVIAGATSPTYTIPATAASDNGHAFSVTVANGAGNTTSLTVTLTVTVNPIITTQPANHSVTVGHAATFSVTAVSGPMPISYQWQVDGANIPLATSSSYTTPPTTIQDSGEKFTVVVSNSMGNVASNTATLTVNPPQAVDVVTYHNDNARTGQNTNETALTHANVNSATFGKIGFFPVDGLVDAQPLHLSNVPIPTKGLRDVLYVVTENDSVYAFDASSGEVLWKVSAQLAGEVPGDDHGCLQVGTTVGITSTPVIDRSRGPNGAIYVVAMSKDNTHKYHQRLHALDITTGAELFGGPTDIQATFPGMGDNTDGTNVIFDPGQYKERVGLLLLPNGKLYTAWASHCDFRPYTGWIMSYDADTLALKDTLNVTPNGNEGAIWMSGAGLAADSSGNIYFLDGNGSFDQTLTNNFPSRNDFGNAFMKLSTAGGLTVADYFEMFNEGTENGQDVDLGSGGALVLPDLTDSHNVVHHLAVGAGKDQNIYVVDRDSMGKFSLVQNNIYQEIAAIFPGNGAPVGIFSSPAYFNNRIFFGSVNNPMMAFGIANAMLSTTPTSQTGTRFAYPGAAPSISASSPTDTTSAILWAIENRSASSGGGPGVLHAYDATNLANELYNSNQAAAGRDHFLDNKFITPTIVNGKVYVGTPTGVMVFGLF